MLAECVLEDLGRGDEARAHAYSALAMLRRLREVVDREIGEREDPGDPNELDPPF
jgi:hypothetical protein